jgi:biotin operon repressor
MRNAGGYVKVYRSMLDWEWYDDTAAVRLMLHLILTANWETRSWHGQDIAPGQLITSMDKLAETLGTSRSAIRRTLDKLKLSGEVTIKTNNHWTTLTLANWAEYQEQQATTDQPRGRQKTNHRPTTGQPPATTKEVKELEEVKKDGLRPARMSFEDFREACRVAHKDAKVLNTEEAKAFFEYWTEGHDSGKGRWQAEPFFDIVRRMRTWGQRAKVSTNGKPVPMTKAEAYAKLEEYRAANGIAPGGVVETHLIPADIYAALK